MLTLSLTSLNMMTVVNVNVNDDSFIFGRILSLHIVLSSVTATDISAVFYKE